MQHADIKPLAVDVKYALKKGLTDSEFQIALSGLQDRGIVKDFYHCYGTFTFTNFPKDKNKKLFQETSKDAPIWADDEPEQARLEFEVYRIDFKIKKLLDFIKSVIISDFSIKRAITQRNGEFFLHEMRIDFDSTNSLHYIIFDILYGEDGESKFFTYENVNKDLIRRGFNNLRNETKSITRIRNAIINGLYQRCGKDFKKYVKIKRGNGVEFLNPSL